MADNEIRIFKAPAHSDEVVYVCAHIYRKMVRGEKLGEDENGSVGVHDDSGEQVTLCTACSECFEEDGGELKAVVPDLTRYKITGEMKDRANTYAGQNRTQDIKFACRHVVEALQALRGADSGDWTQQGDALVCAECL